MHYLFKNSIALLMALAFMPSPKAAAEEWSCGIKIGPATSFMLPDGEKQKEGLQQQSLKASAWNPSLGAALYMGCDLNDHIGLGMEVLYSKFDGVFNSTVDQSKSGRLMSFHTIGLPVLLAWSWTALIRPDFKKDCFHGRIFMGFHPFWRMSGVQISKNAAGEEEQKKDLPFDKDRPRYKFGFIGGISLEFPSGLLLEVKGMVPYNFLNEKDKKERFNIQSFHLSVGYNFAKLY